MEGVYSRLWHYGGSSCTTAVESKQQQIDAQTNPSTEDTAQATTANMDDTVFFSHYVTAAAGGLTQQQQQPHRQQTEATQIRVCGVEKRTEG